MAFTPFKIKNWFGAKDPIATGLRSRVIYKFSYTGYSACYIGETNHYEPTEGAHQGSSNSNMNMTWQRFKAALNGSIDRAENRGLCMVNGMMATYEQRKLSPSAYYNKRWVLPDGVHTEPIEFHTT